MTTIAIIPPLPAASPQQPSLSLALRGPASKSHVMTSYHATKRQASPGDSLKIQAYEFREIEGPKSAPGAERDAAWGSSKRDDCECSAQQQHVPHTPANCKRGNEEVELHQVCATEGST